MSYHFDLSVSLSVDARLRAKVNNAIKEMKVGGTHFTDEELHAILFIYYKLAKKVPMEMHTCMNALYKLFRITDNDILERICFAVSPKDDYIDPAAWAQMLSIFCRGTLDEKITFAFKVYDSMNLGYLSRNNMIKMLSSTIVRKSLLSTKEIEDYLDVLMRRVGMEKLVTMNLEKYRMEVRQQPSFLEMFGQCFPARENVLVFLSGFSRYVSTVRNDSCCSPIKRQIHKKKVKFDN